MSEETQVVADVKSLAADVEKGKADLELEFARVKVFWAKYGHPALYAVVSAVSAYVGHKL